MPIRGRKVYSGYVARSSASSGRVRWLTQMVVVASAGGDHVVHQAGGLAEVGALREGQVDGDALQPGPRVPGEDRGGGPEPTGRQAVAQHAGELLEHEAGVGLPREQVLDVLEPPEGVDERGR